MQGDDFIIFAGKLSVQGSIGPAGYRSATSRAYYGAYHLLLEYLGSLGHYCNTDNSHRWVKQCLGNCSITEGIELGQRIGNLHTNRKDADYDLDEASAETQANAQACVLRADAIRELLAPCRIDPLRSRIAAGVEYYRRHVIKDLA